MRFLRSQTPVSWIGQKLGHKPVRSLVPPTTTAVAVLINCRAQASLPVFFQQQRRKTEVSLRPFASLEVVKNKQADRRG